MIEHEHARPASEYLGRGWAFPVRWLPPEQPEGAPPAASPARRAALAEAEEDVRQAVLLLLRTSIGERVMRPDFGAGIDRYTFAPRSPATLFRLQDDVRRVLVRWEPRIMVERVAATPAEDDDGRIDVDIEYRVDPHRRPENLVFPFYLENPR
ncbi:MAG: GPW/gp25 family protein [Actinomycetota bacterium]|nr:GPW/gp25 family protein [Actinomycetota bacterium]